MMIQHLHFIHLSMWPFISSVCIGSILFFLVFFFHFKFSLMLVFILMIMVTTLILWWRDVIRESSYLSFHTFYVRRGLESGMILFILSEVMFFFSFFWTFFHFSLSPSMELGGVWPSIGLEPLNPFSVPLLNTLILLSSGISLTYSHHCLINNDNNNSVVMLIITISLGLYFSLIQLSEYKELSFCMSDGAYGSIFYMGTGFHGCHVIVGSLFLLSALYRMLKKEFSMSQHLGMEMAAWYWHFVDVVWIFLFFFMYWWSKEV